MPLVASKLSRFSLDADKIVSSGSIRVQAIFISNPTASVVEAVFQDNSAIPLLNMTVSPFDSESWIVPWIADNGLTVLSVGSADVIVTVAHTSEGA